MSRSGIVRDGSHAEVPHPRGVRDLKRERHELADRIWRTNRAANADLALADLVFARLAEHFAAVAGGSRGPHAWRRWAAWGAREAGPHSDLDLVLLARWHVVGQGGRGRCARSVSGTRSGTRGCSWITRRVRSPNAARWRPRTSPQPRVCSTCGTSRATSRSPSRPGRPILADWRVGGAQAPSRTPRRVACARRTIRRACLPHRAEHQGVARRPARLREPHRARRDLADRPPPRRRRRRGANTCSTCATPFTLRRGRAAHIVGRHVAARRGRCARHGRHRRTARRPLPMPAAPSRSPSTARSVGARRSLEKSGVGSRAFLAKRRGAAPRHVHVAQGLIDVDGELALAPGYAAEDRRRAAAARGRGRRVDGLILHA